MLPNSRWRTLMIPYSSMLALPAICLIGLLITLPLADAQEKRGAKPESTLGNWRNVDADTRGLTRLQIVEDKGAFTIQAWGKCHPTDCDWGATTLHHLGDSVDAQERPYGLATWDKSFAVTHLMLRTSGGELVVQTYTLFTDGSRRANYRSEYRFKRAR